LRTLLESEGYESWPKLTGGSGLHVMAPIERALAHREVHKYALKRAHRIAARRPDKCTTFAGAENRVGKLLRKGRDPSWRLAYG
jgi:bifunctional non-homologous end joining protein LigD